MVFLLPPQESFVQRRPEGGLLTLPYEGASGPLTVKAPVGRLRVETASPGSGRVLWDEIPTGGPFELTTDDGSGEPATHTVFCGDLWLMAGQSNMEGVGLLVEASPPHPLVRVFSMARRWKAAVDPLHVLAESPDEVHNSAPPTSPFRGAGVGLPFGRVLIEATGVPQGLIATAHGGTSMAEWSPELAPLEGRSLYGSLLTSVRAVGQPLAGVLWFQGCSDTSPEAAALYTDRMVALVGALRRDLDQPTLPWLTVQIGVEVGRTHQVEAWHEVQEQQRRLPERIEALDVAASADLEHDDWIHVSARDFPRLAARLASMAQRLCLGLPEKPQPQPGVVRWAPDAVSPALELDCHHVSTLHALGLPQGFALVDEAGRERKIIYQVRFEGSRVRLRLTDDDLTGAQLYHGLGAEPTINTFDERGFPLPVFGPLPIQGLPPVSGWFRRWRVSGPLAVPVATVDPRVPVSGPRRFWEGWNVITLQEEWKDGEETRVAVSQAEVPEPMTVEVVAGGDGPLRVWWDGREVIADLDPRRDLSATRTSLPLAVDAGRHEVRVAMSNRGGQAWGFYLRLRRCDAASPLPFELRDDEGSS